ncbi:AB hydrolase-1 domain-containing protein [Mycena kentingensis (nom. inval.)]|nr:AB hydrolase-1 domain-containing protein [Mycena kentingensis (nom. inval.)]
MATTVKECVSADGTIVYSEGSGNPENPGVVFVHGFALSGIVFDHLFCDNRLLDKLYLVRYDVRGHGRSGKPVEPAAYTSLRRVECSSPPPSATSAPTSPRSPSAAPSPSPAPSSPKLHQKTLRPLLESLIPKFLSSDDAPAARAEFINAIFASPPTVPDAVKAAWIRATAAHPPECTRALLTGHDPAESQPALERCARAGLPIMMLNGTSDRIQDGAVGVEEARKLGCFVDFTDARVEGGSRALFYDNLDEVVGWILPFCERVLVQG